MPAPDFFERYAHLIQPEPNSGCWLWTGGATKGRKLAGIGYGLFTLDQTKHYAHRCAYEAVHGEGSAAGLVVRHTCDMPLCVNPDHLLLGTHADNARDAVERGRVAWGERSGTSVLTSEQVWGIIGIGFSLPQPEIARQFGITQSAVSLILSRKRWRNNYQKPPQPKEIAMPSFQSTKSELHSLRIRFAGHQNITSRLTILHDGIDAQEHPEVFEGQHAMHRAVLKRAADELPPLIARARAA